MSNRAAAGLVCRPDLLLSPLNGEPGRYAVQDLRTGDRYSLGSEEYFLLARLGEQSAAGLCRAFHERFGESLSETELDEFVETALERGLLQPAAPETGPGEDDHGAPAGCAYDEVPYGSRPYAQTHPDNLATVATLFGMSPPPVERCRVLELGCGSGGNLLPLAASLPEGRFVGIDLSRRQIADGRHAAQAAGLDNVELRAESILEAGDLGTFDYIVCHGVYSWVPAAVQDRILEICAGHLAPNGIAYVSYNTYPGWHLPGGVREMMRYHADRFAEPQVRVRQARALLEFLAGSALPETDAYGGALQKELTMLRGVPDYYLFHEYLAEVNAPVYFHEFDERARARGMQYLGEAAFLDMLAGHFAPAVGETLRLLAPDLVQAEQYMDFLRNRRFRQTLLCHQGVRLNRSLDLGALDGAYVASPFQPVSASPDVGSAAVEEFRTAQGFPLTTGEPTVKAALVHLAQVWPGAVSMAELEQAVGARLGLGADATLGLRANLLKAVGPKALELRITPPRFVREIGPCPTATPLARFQTGGGTPVTNLRHQAVVLNPLDRLVLRHLDGRRDRAELVRVLADEADRENPARVLDESLGRLASHALLAR